MPRLSVICATPPSVNPGMVLSDATAKAFIKLHGLGDATQFFRVVPGHERLGHIGDQSTRDGTLAGMDSGIEFQTLESPDDIAGTIPLFWGDFLHERMYIDAMCILHPSRAGNIRQALLLSGAYSPLRTSAMTFGTTFVHNRTLDYSEDAYSRDFSSFMADARYVSLRDVYSAAIAQQARLSPDSCLGVDAVQLLYLPAYRKNVLGHVDLRSNRTGIGVYFARFQHEPSHVAGLAAACRDVTSGDVKWIDWGDATSFPHLGSMRDVFNPEAYRIIHPFDLARALTDFRLVITDTYHCAVTSWCLGVPAVLVTGHPHDREVAGNPLHHLTRIDKRSTLYYQFGLNDWIVTPAILSNRGATRLFVEKIASNWLSRPSEALAPILGRMEAFASTVEARLGRAVVGSVHA